MARKKNPKHSDPNWRDERVNDTWEAETGCDSGHSDGDQMVEVTISGRRQLQGSEADVVQCFVVDAVGFVCVLHELVDRKGGVVGLHHCVGHLELKSD